MWKNRYDIGGRTVGYVKNLLKLPEMKLNKISA